MSKKYFLLTRVLLLAVFLASTVFVAKAQLLTSKIFGDHMVLQRNKPVVVWGNAKKNTALRLSFNGQLISTRTKADGSWKATLQPMKEGGPYTMTISCGADTLQYKDIMMGEVWLCSGQSNMEFVLKNSDGYQQEQKVASRLAVRQFFVPHRMSINPEKELDAGAWVPAGAATIGDFTAVGYYFAKQLAAQLHVTVGLVHSSWGGTQAECWVSKDAMLKSATLNAIAKSQPNSLDEVKSKVEQDIKNYAYHNQAATLYTFEQLAAAPASFFNSWNTGTPGAWMWQGKWSAFRGEGFMQRIVTLDSAQAKVASVLRLGHTDAKMAIAINGNVVYKGDLPEGTPINIPAGTWKAGDNSLLLNLQTNQKNPAWFGFGLNGDKQDLFIKLADTTVSLMDNKWRLMADWAKPYHMELMPNNTVATLYNGMIAPLIPLSVAGVLWYQGESNAGRAFQYRDVLATMIGDWRNQWKSKLPFVVMQLPAYGPTQNSNQGSTWAELREAQAAVAVKYADSALVVTTDIGDPNNLHPTNKAPFGYRAAGVALNRVYHYADVAVSPLFNSATFQQNYALVTFNDANGPLTVKDKYGYLKGFEVAGNDHVFHYAQAQLINNTVKVWSTAVQQPVAVRYAWSDSPVDANLFGGAGLPVGPFRSDTWAGITDNVKLVP
ncbi:sialate O-acetylesterase [Mucilaginibacter polytrichastri]|uniref:Sialate O-acetylesterase domain-containing protein n=1 Tax=Mucilaginibacter polytrichastri TaxID=1302689 RepID=A0A1Q5ZT32_9SPHI|nr:sialate O-acetylesterase [Mucilaginibacter polytrichastri]OKS84932.1 hypothetical protein RG47T_0370 [Mucilaginibacter polytrichastri]SFS47429.1 sialate O-acetylesterase [Mucilaginibacter polytrichastri]